MTFNDRRYPIFCRSEFIDPIFDLFLLQLRRGGISVEKIYLPSENPVGVTSTTFDKIFTHSLTLINQCDTILEIIVESFTMLIGNSHVYLNSEVALANSRFVETEYMNEQRFSPFLEDAAFGNAGKRVLDNILVQFEDLSEDKLKKLMNTSIQFLGNDHIRDITAISYEIEMENYKKYTIGRSKFDKNILSKVCNNINGKWVILKCHRLFRPQFRKFNPSFVSEIP